jgi:chemotaxis protein CheD
MISPLLPLDIFLHPGDYYFADRDTRIRTVLGSCVAITFWHPQLLVGGMCHYMLPESGIRHGTSDQPGRYADTAIALLLEEIALVGASYEEYQVKLFGGGSMFPEADKGRRVKLGIQNAQAAQRLVKQYGFTCVAEHLGETGHLNVIFEVWSGEVWVKRNDVLPITVHKPMDRSLG